MNGRPLYRRRQRLKGAEVGVVLASGRRLRGSSIIVQVRSNGLETARLGMIVPKRYLPRAVDRNRVKRLLREWFRQHQTQLRGQDILVRLTAPLPEPAQATRDMESFFPAKQ